MNKHVVIALVIAPILAVIAWFAVEKLWGEQPQPAAPGISYPLLAKSNCRYESGLCTLENNDLSLEIRFTGTGFSISTSHPLDAVLIAVGDETAKPVAMTHDPSGLDVWFTASKPPMPTDRIYLVATYRGATFFGETATSFVKQSQ